MRTPDLICLGAQKSATTWLYDILRKRPEIFLPPIKEIHYFSQLYSQNARKFGPRHRRDQCDAGLRSGQGRAAEFEHLARPDVDDDWYRKIFAPALPEQTCFEICPSYMNMPEEAVRHVLRLNPSVRLLVMVRDPVERCWSQIRMHIKRGQEDLDAILEGRSSLWPFLFYTDYAAALRRWSAHTAPGQLKVMLHDRVREAPDEAIAEIYAFAGLPAPDIAGFRGLTREVFKGEAISIPDSLRARLLEELAPQYDFLRTQFPEAVAGWLSRHEKALNAA